MKNIIIKKTKQFETICFRLVFPFEEKEEDMAKLCLLPSMLNYMSKKYPTEEEFKKAKLNNYILSYGCNYSVIGTSGFITFNLITVNPSIIKDNSLAKVIEFLKESIYEPKVINKGFDKFEIRREIDNVKRYWQNKTRQLTGYLDLKVSSLVDDEGIFSRSIGNHLDQFDSLTPQELYTYYQDIIQSKSPYIFIIGDVKKKELTTLLSKQFDFTKPTVTSEFSYNHFLKPKEVQYITEEKDFKESAVSLSFKFKDISSEDRPTINMLRRLLSSDITRLLFNKLRTEAGLVYSVDTLNHYRYNVFEIVAYTNNDKLELAKDKILEVLDELKNSLDIQPLIDEIIEDYKIAETENKDYQGYILDDIMDEYFKLNENKKKRLAKISNCQAIDIKNLIERMQLDTCLYVKEIDHE